MNGNGPLVLVLRLVHVGLGVFWAGSIFMMALFLDPAARASGPAGGQVMGAMAQRKFTPYMVLFGSLTVLMGWILYWRLSGGFTAAYVASTQGVTFLIGGLAATAGLGVGIFVSRPTFEKLSALMATVGSLPEAERGGVMAQVAALRARMTTALRVVASLLAIAVVVMAVGRYL